MILLNFSIPVFTPRATTSTEMPRNTRCIAIGSQGEEMKSENTRLTSPGETWKKPGVIDFII